MGTRRLRSRHESNPRALLLLDAAALLLTWLPGSLTLMTCGAWLLPWRNFTGRLFAIGTLPVVACTSFILSIALLRLCLPRLRAGIFAPGFNTGFVAWYSHLALTRAARAFPLQALLQSTYLTRFLYWRALGARIAYGVHSSFTLDLADAPLVSIGRDTTIAEGVRIAAHHFIGTKVYIAPITIGRGCFIGMGAFIGPHSRIDDYCWIAAEESVERKKITRAAS